MTIDVAWDDELIIWWEDVADDPPAPGDLMSVLNDFADEFLDGGHRAHPVDPTLRAVLRSWRSVSADVDLGRQVGFEAAEIVATRSDVHPGDVLVVCERRRDGREAARVIEACGFPTLHLFAEDRGERLEARESIASGGTGIRGCRSDEIPLAAAARPVREVVVGLGTRQGSRQQFHDAVASVTAAGGDGTVYVTVLCADPELASFADGRIPVAPPLSWSAPDPDGRVADLRSTW
jgi:hypothetical protein